MQALGCCAHLIVDSTITRVLLRLARSGEDLRVSITPHFPLTVTGIHIWPRSETETEEGETRILSVCFKRLSNTEDKMHTELWHDAIFTPTPIPLFNIKVKSPIRPELQTSANKGLVVLSECSKMNQLASKGFFQLKYAARIKTQS